MLHYLFRGSFKQKHRPLNTLYSLETVMLLKYNILRAAKASVCVGVCACVCACFCHRQNPIVNVNSTAPHIHIP